MLGAVENPVYLRIKSENLIYWLLALFGIAIVALPAGSVTAGYMEEINKEE